MGRARRFEPRCEPRILLHQFARQILALGVEHDETEWPVEAPAGEPHATLGIPRLKPRRVLLNDASLLLACIREEPLVKRGPDNIRELHTVSLSGALSDGERVLASSHVAHACSLTERLGAFVRGPAPVPGPVHTPKALRTRADGFQR